MKKTTPRGQLFDGCVMRHNRKNDSRTKSRVNYLNKQVKVSDANYRVRNGGQMLKPKTAFYKKLTKIVFFSY